MDVADHPNNSGHLDVGDGQSIYWEEWGNPDGVPALYLHGGPGGTLASSAYRRRFDLARTRVVGFEQRGCGRSTPHVSDPAVTLDTNDTHHLIGDIETLREHLGINSWIVNGVSWGSTLALAYAQTHPGRVLGIALYAVTSTSASEVRWITEGVSAVFPEAWDALATHAEQAGIGYERGNGRLIDAYSKLMESPDLDVRDAASRAWALWEDTHVSLGTGGVQRDPRWDDDRFRIAFLRLTAHYWAKSAFCDPPLLDRMDLLSGIAGFLLHGRRDISSPVATAWKLHRAWPGSTLIIDEGDGHGGASMAQRWREANDQLVGRAEATS